MKFVLLTQGYEAIVDDDDYGIVMDYTWQVIGTKKKGIYAKRSFWINKKYYIESLHNFIMPPPTGFTIDHIDRNGLNCQRQNMRFATKAQQNANRSSKNKWGYRGVAYSGRGWKVEIRYEKKLLYLGTYDTAEYAAKIYDKKAKEFYGEFATLNYPETK